MKAMHTPDITSGQEIQHTAEQLLDLRESLGYMTVGRAEGRIIGNPDGHYLELPHGQITVSPQKGDRISIRDERDGLVAWSPTGAPKIGGDMNGMHIPRTGILIGGAVYVNLTAETDPASGKPVVRGSEEKIGLLGLRSRTRALTTQEIQAQAAKVLAATSKEK